MTGRKVEDKKGTIESRKSKKGDRQFNGKEIIIYITLHRKLKIEQHEPHWIQKSERSLYVC